MSGHSHALGRVHFSSSEQSGGENVTFCVAVVFLSDISTVSNRLAEIPISWKVFSPGASKVSNRLAELGTRSAAPSPSLHFGEQM